MCKNCCFQSVCPTLIFLKWIRYLTIFPKECLVENVPFSITVIKKLTVKNRNVQIVVCNLCKVFRRGSKTFRNPAYCFAKICLIFPYTRKQCSVTQTMSNFQLLLQQSNTRFTIVDCKAIRKVLRLKSPIPPSDVGI